jgi:hypothetical protein
MPQTQLKFNNPPIGSDKLGTSIIALPVMVRQVATLSIQPLSTHGPIMPEGFFVSTGFLPTAETTYDFHLL